MSCITSWGAGTSAAGGVGGGGGGGSAAAAAIPKDESGVLQVADVPKYRIDDNPPNNPADSAGWYAAWRRGSVTYIRQTSLTKTSFIYITCLPNLFPRQSNKPERRPKRRHYLSCCRTGSIQRPPPQPCSAGYLSTWCDHWRLLATVCRMILILVVNIVNDGLFEFVDEHLNFDGFDGRKPTMLVA